MSCNSVKKTDFSGSMEMETVLKIIWGLLKKGKWHEARVVSEVVGLPMMKTELSRMEVILARKSSLTLYL